MLRAFTVLIACSLLGYFSLAQAPDIAVQKAPADADWPIFRGDPLQSGIAKTTLPDKLEIRWKVDLKKGIESTACIVDGVVYIGCYDDHLHAFDLATGNEKWKSKLGPIKAPPSYYKGKIFVGVPPLVVGWSHKYEEVLEIFGCEGDAVDFSEAEQKIPMLVERMLAEYDTTRERILKTLPTVTTSAVSQFDQMDRLAPAAASSRSDVGAGPPAPPRD